MKNILVIGSGGREHSLAWKLSQSKNVGDLFVAPGNGGTALFAQNVSIQADNIPDLIIFAKENNIDLTVVGPDNSLAAGIVDAFQTENLKIFGPTKKAAKIEWSKAYAKRLMKKYSIPTAEFATFSSYESALEYVQKTPFPLVVKADGLALGKGVIICQNFDEAIAAIKELKNFGKSGLPIVIEEYLEGIEVSAHAICDGDDFLLFPLARDHKRIGDGNTGPNTGGMGTICPVPGPLGEITEIIDMALSALKKEGREFSGCLFPGIMLTKNGPKVLEFNARFGDPETQVYMRLLDSDLLEILEAATEKRLTEFYLKWKPGAAACIVLASAGYPGEYQKGYEITGVDNLPNSKVIIFHAGTKVEKNKIITAGGRVLNITATGDSLDQALEKGYKAVKEISFQGKTFRKDIGIESIDKVVFGK